MPTVGWIAERDMDRYERGRPPEPQIPLVLQCPFCPLQLQDTNELKRHVSHQHALELPVLIIEGQRAHVEMTFRSALRFRGIAIPNAIRCFVQKNNEDRWHEVEIDNVRRRLSSIRNAVYRLRLRNERAVDSAGCETEYTLRFRIPTEDDLEYIDQAFAKHFTSRPLMTALIERFAEECPMRDGSRDYAGALADYITALMLKEQTTTPRSHLNFTDFASKMQSAVEVLRGMHRPLAQAVAACIDLNLNNFGTSTSNLDSPRLKLSLEFFRSLHHDAAIPTLQAHLNLVSQPICPVDELTDKLIEAVTLLTEGRTTPQEIHGVALGGSASEQDIVKARVICAYGALASSDMTTAKRYLKLLRFDHVFRNWALERIKQIDER